ncbi:terminase [Edwardsiella tarda]|uniref:terminase n=2 Tax=Edwardsiella tarda TaxID=636 RepID=UPI001EF9CB63|nr:terminase [Edwardsiella tarda]
MARKKPRSIMSDPRYRDLVYRYRYNWALAAIELFGKTPTWQQDQIIDSVQQVGSWTTVSSGHGTGKSDMTSIMIMCFIIMFPGARVVLVANKIGQVMTGVFKYIKTNWATCVRRHPWLEQYFVLTDQMFYAREAKGVWEVVPKGFRLGNEEALAGEHAEHLFYIIDEASGVSDKAFGVMTGALTQSDNRILLLSQPTRGSGYFYDSHHRYAKAPDNPDGLFTAITLNSEDSPLVTVRFIKQKLVEYGGRDSPEYQIKVLGQFPKTTSGYLLGRDECDRAARRQVRLKVNWGWLATVDVGNGRDSSVLSIFRVSGWREKRRAVPVLVREMNSEIDPVTFASFIVSELRDEVYPNICVAVDSDGVGDTVSQLLENAGLRVQRIRWGKPMHSKKDKERFRNQRAWANVAARDAIRSGRLALDKHKKTLEQASKIPYFLTETGAIQMVKKEIMRQKMNIKSPDRWDTYCFAMLADYIPRNEYVPTEVQDSRNSVAEWLDS